MNRSHYTRPAPAFHAASRPQVSITAVVFPLETGADRLREAADRATATQEGEGRVTYSIPPEYWEPPRDDCPDDCPECAEEVVPPICEQCGAPVMVYDALVDRTVPHDCRPKAQ